MILGSVLMKKLSLLIILSMLCVQNIVPLHEAAHGFDKHEHDGRVCDLYLYHSQKQILTGPDASNLHVIRVIYSISYHIPLTRAHKQSPDFSLSHSRAPPFIS
jgi:hypothetical protein